MVTNGGFGNAKFSEFPANGRDEVISVGPDFRFLSRRGIMGETRGWRKGFPESFTESRRSV